MLYVTDGDWGTGTHDPLAAADVDGNFWEVIGRIVALEEADNQGVGIESIDVAGNLMTITLTDSTPQGPFALPVAQWTWKEWANSIHLNVDDLVTVADRGIWRVLIAHDTAADPAEFDPALLITGQPAFVQIFGTTIPPKYKIAGGPQGLIPGDGDDIFHYLTSDAFTLPADLVGSVFKLLVATTAIMVCNIYKNATLIGTLTWAAAGTVPTVAFVDAVAFVSGDFLRVTAPASADATAETLGLNFLADAA